MTETVVPSWTGREAHALRVALRMTAEGFAEHLGLAARAVAKWDTQPNMVPNMSTQQVLDVALERAPAAAKKRFALLLRDGRNEERPTLVDEPGEVVDQVFPRPGLGLVVPTAEALMFLRRNLRQHYVDDNLVGPRFVLPVLMSQLRTIEELRQNSTGPMLEQLLRIGAGYAEFIGWLYQDSGDLETARVWCGRALEWAQAGGDDRMAAFILMRRAAQALTGREGAYAAKVAGAAQRFNGRETARVRAIAYLTEAHGHAIAGAESDVDRALERAAVLVQQEPEASDDDPSGQRYCELDVYAAIQRAKCELELGRAESAITSFGNVLGLLPGLPPRPRPVPCPHGPGLRPGR